jgi:hypothetical protein
MSESQQYDIAALDQKSPCILPVAIPIMASLREAATGSNLACENAENYPVSRSASNVTDRLPRTCSECRQTAQSDIPRGVAVGFLHLQKINGLSALLEHNSARAYDE